MSIIWSEKQIKELLLNNIRDYAFLSNLLKEEHASESKIFEAKKQIRLHKEELRMIYFQPVEIEPF